MFNLNKFIADSVTFRQVSMFAADIEANKEKLSAEIKSKKELLELLEILKQNYTQKINIENEEF